MSFLTRGRMARAVVAAGIGLPAALLQAACDGMTSPSDLIGAEWRLESMQLPGVGTVTPDDPGQFTIDFGAEGELGVGADCNGCGGEYSLDDDTLVVSNLVCTLIACPSAPVDAQFLGVLQGTSTVEVDDEVLTITSTRGTLRLTR